MVANAGAEALLKPILKPHELGPVWNLMPQMHFVSNPLNKTVNHLLSHAHRRLAVKQLPDGVDHAVGRCPCRPYAGGAVEGLAQLR